MSGRRTLATAGRVLAQIAHDPRTVVLLLVVPSLLIGLMAWLLDDTPVFARVGPAMLALFPFIVMFLVTSIATLRERRSGTLERLLTLRTAPLDLVVGYLLAFGALAIVQALVAVGYAVVVCGLDVHGSLALLVVVALADAVLGTALGLFASAFARTEFQVVQFLPVFVFPQVLLGGVLLPRDDMPAVLRTISDWLPLSHAVDALDAVARDDHGIGYVLAELLVVCAFSAAAVVLGAVTLRRRTA